MKAFLITCIACLFANGAAAQVPTNGLVAEYLFSNGSYDDTNPNGIGPNHAVAPAAVLNTTDRFGNPDHAKDLAGIEYQSANATYITLGSSTVLKPREATVSIWVNLDQLSNSGWGYPFNPIIIATNTRSPSSYMEAYSLYITLAKRELLTLTTNPRPINQTLSYRGHIEDDQWHHYVMTYDDDTLKCYLDGVLLAAQYKGYNSAGTFSGEQVRVGSSMNPIYNRALDGAVDDIRIYNRVLSHAEVLALYHEVNPVVYYASLQEDLDGGYYAIPSEGNALYFQYRERWKSGTLSYKVYDQNRTDITASAVLENMDGSGAAVKHYGINQYKLLLPNLSNQQVYVLEVTDEKGKKNYLRFSQI